jgi:hypothetical protein
MAGPVAWPGTQALLNAENVSICELFRRPGAIDREYPLKNLARFGLLG